MRATQDLTPDIRLIEIAPVGRFRRADAGQPHQCRRADRRSARRALLFDRRPLRRRRLSHRGQAACGNARRLGLYVDAGARRAHRGVGAGQSFRTRPRPARLSARSPAASASRRSSAMRSRSPRRARASASLYACRTPADAALADELQARIGDRLTLVFGGEGGRHRSAGGDRQARARRRGLCLRPDRHARGGQARLARRAGGRSTSCGSRPSAAAGAIPTSPFTVKIPRLGREIAVDAHQSLLEALEAAGVDMIFDCRRGECGLCALPILAVDGDRRPSRRVLQRSGEGGGRQALHLRLPRLWRVDHAGHRGSVSVGSGNGEHTF